MNCAFWMARNFRRRGSTRLCLMLAVLSLAWSAEPVHADEIRPFFSRNLHPIVQIFGLPPAEGGFLVAPGATDLRLVAEAANHFCGSVRDHANAFFDGETYRLTLAVRQGLAPRWELGLDVGLVAHDGGVLDAVVDEFHDLSGARDHGRDKVPRDELLYYYHRDGVTYLEMDRSGAGFSDVTLLLAYQLVVATEHRRRALALRGGVKLPTGDAARLHGSGATDVHVRLAGTDAQSLRALNLTLYASAGVLRLGRGDVLPQIQREWVGFATLGLGWKARNWLALKAQVDGHTAFFRDSCRKQINSPSAQLVFGGTFFLPRHWSLDLAASEDLVLGTAPDVSFHLSLGRRF
ncbi:Protein of unknown function [Geoalkalibacter ferrihydriticus]|uniref:DUF3187 family protein n=1 Tax=Geoalkalibacter ferrihydriticus TaxID=392333 RepID=A0A1G9MPN3_9BACT|nr:DUF3187 family protein [Geoalkalibacter ferrihydriticus]SDL75971.1 Protein of unknown function [Geoalkalibacter ferrihydriticus]